MRHLPLFLDLNGRRVVLVGGGTIAARKFELLQRAGARVLVVAPRLGPELSAAASGPPQAAAFEHRARPFAASDLDGAHLAVAATGDAGVNHAVAAAAAERGLFVNVVDDAQASTAIVPAIVDRSPLLIAVSSGGAAPELARRVRQRIEALLDGSLAELARFLERWRTRIRAAVTDLPARRRLYEWLLDGPVAQRLRTQRPAAAERLLATALERGVAPRAGSVALVGAGPGDPGLLTLNALRALQAADVVLHDRLVTPEVLALVRRDAQLIEVGKGGGRHSTRQHEIHALLAEHAGRGLRVVRLKGGDPFVFGRGGEELEFLAARGIAYEVIPGITAALACAAYAGIPLTHREHSGSVRFVTAHCRESVESTDWHGLAQGRETLAVYMGVGMLETLTRELLAHGREASTPVAFIENGGRRTQRVLAGALGSAVELAAEHALKAPALLIVGEVAALAHTLGWFGSPPLTTSLGAARDAA